MPRGENFRRKPGPGRRKGSKNRATPEIREAARRLVEDPQYCASLWQRLREGNAGQMEVVLWKYALAVRGGRAIDVVLSHGAPPAAMYDESSLGDRRGPRRGQWWPVGRTARTISLMAGWASGRRQAEERERRFEIAYLKTEGNGVEAARLAWGRNRIRLRSGGRWAYVDY